MVKPVVATEFVVPALTAYGEIKSGQRRKPGMLVLIKKSRAAWGNVKVEQHFYAQIVKRTASGDFIVRPVNGVQRRYTLNEFQINTDGYYTNVGYAHFTASHTMRVSSGSMTVINPLTLSEEWFVQATKLRQRMHEVRVGQFRTELYRKLAAAERRGPIGRKAHRPQWGVTSMEFYKPQRTLGRRVGVWIRKLDAMKVANDFSMLPRYTDGEVGLRTALEIFQDRNPGLERGECGHLSFNQVPVIGMRLSETTACAACAANSLMYRPMMSATGVVRLSSNTLRTYGWSDGTTRTAPEPEIIGGYHSSKRYIQALPNLDGSVFTGLTLGMELEMECANSSGGSVENYERNRCAALVHKKMTAATPAAWSTNNRYAFYERDGSVDSGFEMVTAYGALEVHRNFVDKVFSAEAGKTTTPFAGILRSHDARASCGLHVHMAKPKSLMHAAKLQAFYNDLGNKNLVRAVARRYSTNYALAQADKGNDYVAQKTKETLSTTRQSYGGRLKNRINTAITNLSGGSRYSQVNFCNAATVEIRVFKGSMLPQTIMACLEFAQASWFFSRDTVATDLTTNNFIAWISRPENRADTRALRAYLAGKGYKVFQPRAVPNQAELATAEEGTE